MFVDHAFKILLLNILIGMVSNFIWDWKNKIFLFCVLSCVFDYCICYVVVETEDYGITLLNSSVITII